MRRFVAFLALAFLVPVTGCTTAMTPVAPSAVDAMALVAPASVATSGAEAQATAVAGATAVSQNPSNDYRIGPLDILDVSVFQVADLSKTVQVTASGSITLPLIGELPAAGKTLAELQADITQKYGATYLRSPQVSVFVHDALSQRITVNGEVNKPGVYPTDGPTSLSQSVAIAGGLTDMADVNDVIVLRGGAGKRVAAKFDLKDIQAGNSTDPILHGGDTVIVDRSGGKAAWKNLREAVPALGVFGTIAPLL